MYKLTLISLLLSSALFANDIPQNVIDAGDKVSSALLKQLSSKLKNELQENGLIAAVRFCHENAYTLTEEINLHQLKGLNVRRISLKQRNPANAPKSDEEETLKQMQALLEQNKLPPFLVKKTPTGHKYYKPLVIKKAVCLKCHGDISKNKELSSFMQEHYPQDKAINYKMNDLRGAILVDIQN
ncbi:MAG TPA: DUF3365 domain-containing protein [Sulfurimonas sp.]|nr:DUF3365 domain-containing protein [Sulfurimonas sp.]